MTLLTGDAPLVVVLSPQRTSAPRAETYLPQAPNIGSVKRLSSCYLKLANVPDTNWGCDNGVHRICMCLAS